MHLPDVAAVVSVAASKAFRFRCAPGRPRVVTGTNRSPGTARTFSARGLGHSTFQGVGVGQLAERLEAQRAIQPRPYTLRESIAWGGCRDPQPRPPPKRNGSQLAPVCGALSDPRYSRDNVPPDRPTVAISQPA